MDTTKPIGLRERKLRETRLNLETATIDLALEHGLEHVTVDMIAERADVSPRTFFNYFPSKEEAIFGLPGGMSSDELLAAFPTEPSAAGAYQDLKQFFITQFMESAMSDELMERRMAVVTANPNLIRSQMSRIGMMLEQLTMLVAQLLNTEQPDSEPSAEVVAEARMLLFLCSSTMQFTFGSWHQKKREAQPARDLGAAFDLLEKVARTHILTESESHHQ